MCFDRCKTSSVTKRLDGQVPDHGIWGGLQLFELWKGPLGFDSLSAHHAYREDRRDRRASSPGPSCTSQRPGRPWFVWIKVWRERWWVLITDVVFNDKVVLMNSSSLRGSTNKIKSTSASSYLLFSRMADSRASLSKFRTKAGHNYDCI